MAKIKSDVKKFTEMAVGATLLGTGMGIMGMRPALCQPSKIYGRGSRNSVCSEISPRYLKGYRYSTQEIKRRMGI